MFHKAWDGREWLPSPTEWEALGGVFNSPPAVASWGVNRLDIFGLGTNNEMFHKAWDGREWLHSPRGWEALGGVFDSPPAVASWGVNRLDIFGLGTNDEMFHKAWDGREWLPSPTEWEALGGVFSTRFGLTAPQLATSRTINSGALTSDLPLGGSVGIVMNENGDFDFTSHAHDSGFDNIDYTISAAIMTPDGFAFTFQHSGSTEGTVAGLPFGTPNRDSDFNTGAENNPLIGTHWDGVLKGTFTAR